VADVYESKRWCAITETVRGATHLKSGLPNQDAIAAMRRQIGIVLAISDGHGSARYVRSDVGARLAVATAIEELSPLLKRKNIRRTSASELESRLAQALVQKWDRAVLTHLAEAPLSAEERIKAGAPATEDRFSYGATLIAIVATSAFMLYLQLGDGDIIVVDKSGNVSRPLPKDMTLLGNETTSLSSPEAWNRMQILIQSLDEDNRPEQPAVILAATDGYANCFKDEAAFLQAGKDYYDLLSQPTGLTAVQKHLHTWLREASDNFSGDDISFALLSAQRRPRKRSNVSKRQAS
jgi:serine/threonine protein phosphatase PrpC